MLSEHERRELRTIEQMLLSDSRFSSGFTRLHSRGERRNRHLARVLVVFGVLITVTAMFLGLGDAFVEGLGLTAAGLLLAGFRPKSARRRPPHVERRR
jgi:Protein of unknown function (DUF3040)